MTGKDYLLQYKIICRDIKSILAEITFLKNLSTQITQCLSPVKVQTALSENKIEHSVIEINYLENKLKDEIHQLTLNQTKIEECIVQLESIQERELLRLHYLCDKSFKEIAKLMCCDYRTVMRIHKESLKNIEVVTPCH